VRARQEYLTHFTALLQAEREAEETNNILRLRQWSVQRLVHEGYTLVDLTVVSQQIVGASPPEEGLRINVKFRIPPSQSTSRYVHSMRLISGDSVRLYPMTTSSSSSSYFFSAKVLERSTNWILVCCPHTHQLTDQLSEREMHWRIDYETNLTTYSRLLRAVQTFVNVQLSSTTHPEIERWQQLLIDKPQTHSQDVERLAASPSMLWTSTSVHLPAIPLSTSHLTSLVPEWSEWPLNPSQRNVIVQVLCRQLSLIQGPPGTGKTHTAVYLLKLLTLLSQRVKGLRLCPMLVCAYTNIAVDNLLEGLLRVGGVRVVRLGRPVKVRPELSTHTLDYRVQQHPKYPSLQMLLERVRTRQLQPGETITTLQQTIRSLTTQIHSDILSQVDCVCATCVGAGDELLDSYSFPLLLVDEATQVSEPALLIGLLRHVQQLIMFGTFLKLSKTLSQIISQPHSQLLTLLLISPSSGDHFQLPPTVVSEKAQQGGLGISLFARLAGTSLTPSSCETHPNELRTSRTSLPNATDTSHRIDTSFPTSSLILVRPFLLQYQYRMHPLLSHFVNWHFYGGVIRDAVNASSRPPPSSFPWPRYDNTLSSFVTVSSLGTQSSLQYDPHHLLTGLATNSSLECVVFSSSPSEGVAPVAFVHVPSVEEATDPDGVVILSSSSSDLHPSTVVKTYRNTTEATILIQTLKTLLNLSVVSKNEPTLMISDVGIITPYRGQLQLINDMLHKDPYFQRFRVRLPSESEQSPEDDVFSFTLDEVQYQIPPLSLSLSLFLQGIYFRFLHPLKIRERIITPVSSGRRSLDTTQSWSPHCHC
jgi:hypothetical protein